MSSIFSSATVMSEYQSEVNNSVPDSIYAKLSSSYSIDSDGYSALMDVISPVFDDDTLASLLSSIDSYLSNLSSNLTSLTSLTANLKCSLTTSNLNKQVGSASVTQDATVSQKFTEPTASETNFASPVDNVDADSGTGEDYPNSYGVANELCDFMKVNRLQGTIQLVHHSGTRVMIDNAGNATVYSAGTTKFISEGDMVIQSGGGLDIIASSGIYLHSSEVAIKGDSSIELDAMQVDLPSATQVSVNEPAIVQVGTLKGTVAISAPAISVG